VPKTLTGVEEDLEARPEGAYSGSWSERFSMWNDILVWLRSGYGPTFKS